MPGFGSYGIGSARYELGRNAAGQYERRDSCWLNAGFDNRRACAILRATSWHTSMWSMGKRELLSRFESVRMPTGETPIPHYANAYGRDAHTTLRGLTRFSHFEYMSERSWLLTSRTHQVNGVHPCAAEGIMERGRPGFSRRGVDVQDGPGLAQADPMGALVDSSWGSDSRTNAAVRHAGALRAIDARSRSRNRSSPWETPA